MPARRQIRALTYVTEAFHPSLLTRASRPQWACSPACTELEAIVMDWSAKLFGLSEEFLNTSGVGGGVLQTTASDSALVAVVAARSLFARRNPSASAESFVIYTTTQTHSLGKKAALILGVQCRALDVTPEDKFALRGDTLRKALAEDKAAGRHPFILSASLDSSILYHDF
jgi:aromatic-L-amino-acid/L-tryptophan decarboxylase